MKQEILEEKKQNELTCKNHEKTFTTPNYFDHFLILAPTISGCI